MSKNKQNNKDSFLKRFFAGNAFCWVSILCTAMIMLLVYFVFSLYPFGDTTILRMDLYHQYGPLFAELYDRITQGKSLIYSWNTGLGTPFLGNFYNYTASPIGILIILLFGHFNMPEAIAAMVLAKDALAAGAFTYYLKKSFGRHDFTTAAFGILYAMCGWFIAYYWNIMWVDSLVIFPFVMLGIEYIINKRKPIVYIISLALTLLTNYYMGYMVCIFSVIYFLYYYITRYDITALSDKAIYYRDRSGNKKYTVFNRITGSLFVRSGVTFAFSSVAAAGLVAFALIPVYIILRSCSATSGTWPEEYKTYFTAFDFLANHLASVEPTIRSSGEDVIPNVFCGVGTLLLVPLYIFSKRFSLKEKIASVFTLGVLYFSFNVNYLNYIWHGFHFPNDLPYRFSFMYVFILLIMAYKAFTNLDEYNGRQILTAGVAVAIAIVIIEKVGSKNVSDISILLSIIFTVTYCLIFYLLKDVRKQKSAVAVILLCTVIAEIACSNTDNYSMSQLKTNYAGDYEAFVQVKDKLDNEYSDGDDSYRMELTYNRARMDPAWYGYNGISTFTSMGYEKMANMQSHLGLYSNYINSFTYYLQTPVYNMMNSLKYVVDNSYDEKVESDYYTPLFQLDKYTAYENNYYLPIAFTADRSLRYSTEYGGSYEDGFEWKSGWYSAYSNPFITQSEWFEYATGVKDVFTFLPISDSYSAEFDSPISGYDSGEFYLNKTSGSCSMEFTMSDVEEAKHLYIYGDSYFADSYIISVNGDTRTYSADEGRIMDVGIINPGDEVTITVSYDADEYNYDSLQIYPYYVNDDKLNEGYEILKSGAMNITSRDETHISGTVHADKSCVMFTSIAYDEGWTVKVDGKEVETYALGDAYLCYDLSAGDHTIEMSFTQRGLKTGIIISVFTLLVLIAVAVLFKVLSPTIDRYYKRKNLKADGDYEARRQQEERLLMAQDDPSMELSPEEIKLGDFTDADKVDVPEGTPQIVTLKQDDTVAPVADIFTDADNIKPDDTGLFDGPSEVNPESVFGPNAQNESAEEIIADAEAKAEADAAASEAQPDDTDPAE